MSPKTPQDLPTLTDCLVNLRGRRVLLTGHSGFKGGWLALWLHEAGAEVFGCALGEENGPAAYSAIGVRGLLRREEILDLRDRPRFEGFYEEIRPEITFHLAAQSLVRRSYQTPIGTIEANILGTANVLEAIRKFGGAGVLVTSDKCYEASGSPRPRVETDPMGGHDVYSMSKGACELLAASYRKSFGLRVATARAGNAIGGGDFAEDRVLPDAVRATREGKPLPLRNPRSVRPWQHVLEPLSGYLALAGKLLGPDGEECAEAWNFGPDPARTATVQELAEGFFRFFGKGRAQADEGALHPQEAAFLSLDSEKARKRLGWKQRWTLEKALRMTAEWYRLFENSSRKEGCLREESVKQISEYERGGS